MPAPSKGADVNNRAGLDPGHSRLQLLSSVSRTAAAAAGLEHGIVGASPALRGIIREIRRIANADSTVLILGESGTGKELAARAIHENSPRAPKPFVAINCAAIAETLLESELFGYEKGAFTGALSQKKGRMELARGGTLFLDEISELTPPLQAKLLRVVQQRELERVGGRGPVPLDCRVIAATNRDLTAAVKNGSFRQDLFHRLNVVAITMPPLRERAGDVRLLANYFLQKLGQASGCRVQRISRQARRALENYPWPGNIRELQNVIERALVLGMSDRIELEDLPEALCEFSAGIAPPGLYHAAVEDARRRIILRALATANGNYTRAARLLGIQVTYLHRLVRSLELRVEARKLADTSAREPFGSSVSKCASVFAPARAQLHDSPGRPVVARGVPSTGANEDFRRSFRNRKGNSND